MSNIIITSKTVKRVILKRQFSYLRVERHVSVTVFNVSANMLYRCVRPANGLMDLTQTLSQIRLFNLNINFKLKCLSFAFTEY